MFQRIVLCLVVAAFLSAGIAGAAQQGAAAKTLQVRSFEGFRALVYRSTNTSSTVVGDPTSNGASLRVTLTPGGTFCFGLPASGWSVVRGGFRYRTPGFGPIKAARIAVNASGKFRLKVIGDPITVDPGNPTNTYGTNFKILGNGDEYCSSTGTVPPTRNDADFFIVRRDDGTACTVAACGSPSAAFLDAAVTF